MAIDDITKGIGDLLGGAKGGAAAAISEELAKNIGETAAKQLNTKIFAELSTTLSNLSAQDIRRAGGKLQDLSSVKEWREEALARLKSEGKLDDAQLARVKDVLNGNAMNGAINLLAKTNAFTKSLDEALQSGQKFDPAKIIELKKAAGLDTENIADISKTMEYARKKLEVAERYVTDAMNDARRVPPLTEDQAWNLYANDARKKAGKPALDSKSAAPSPAAPAANTAGPSPAPTPAAPAAAADAGRTADPELRAEPRQTSEAPAAKKENWFKRTFHFDNSHKKGVEIKSGVDNDFAVPGKVLKYDTEGKGAFANQSPLRILAHLHYTNSPIFQKWMKLREIFGGKIKYANLSEALPRAFIVEKFVRPVVRSIDESINAAGLVPDAVKLEKSIKDIAKTLAGDGDLAVRKTEAASQIKAVFANFAAENQEGLKLLEESAKRRIEELEALRFEKNADGTYKRLEKPEELGGELRLKKIPKEELLSERQYKAMIKYLEDMRNMAVALRQGDTAGNTVMKEFLDKVNEASNGANDLAHGATSRLGRIGSDVRLRLADKYEGESVALKDRHGAVVDGPLAHNMVVSRDVYKLETELEAGLYFRNTRWIARSATAANNENTFSSFVHFVDKLPKHPDGSPNWSAVGDQNNFAGRLVNFFNQETSAYGLFGIRAIMMKQGIMKDTPIADAVKQIIEQKLLSNNPKTSAEGEFWEAALDHVSENYEYAYKFGERDIVERFGYQDWEYFKRGLMITAGEDKPWSVWGVPAPWFPAPGAPAAIIVNQHKAAVKSHIQAFLTGGEVGMKTPPDGTIPQLSATGGNPLFKMRPHGDTEEGAKALKELGLENTPENNTRWARLPRVVKLLDNYTGGTLPTILASGGLLYRNNTGIHFNKSLFYNGYLPFAALAVPVAGVTYALSDKQDKSYGAEYVNTVTAPVRYGMQGATNVMGYSLSALGWVPDGITRGVSLLAEVTGVKDSNTPTWTFPYIHQAGGLLLDGADKVNPIIDEKLRLGGGNSSASPSTSASSSAPAGGKPISLSEAQEKALKTLGFGELPKDLEAIRLESGGKAGDPKAWFFDKPVVGNVDKAKSIAENTLSLAEKLAKQGELIDAQIETFSSQPHFAKQLEALKVLKEQHKMYAIEAQAALAVAPAFVNSVTELNNVIQKQDNLTDARGLLEQQRAALAGMEANRTVIAQRLEAVQSALNERRTVPEDAAEKKHRVESMALLSQISQESTRIEQNSKKVLGVSSAMAATVSAYDALSTDLATKIEAEQDAEKKKQLELLKKQVDARIAIVKDSDTSKGVNLALVNRQIEQYDANNAQIQQVLNDVSAGKQKPAALKEVVDKQAAMAEQIVASKKALDDDITSIRAAINAGKPYQPAQAITTSPASGSTPQPGSGGSNGNGQAAAPVDKPLAERRAAELAKPGTNGTSFNYPALVASALDGGQISTTGETIPGIKELYDRTKKNADIIERQYSEVKGLRQVDPKLQQDYEDSQRHLQASANALQASQNALTQINALKQQYLRETDEAKAKDLRDKMAQIAAAVYNGENKGGYLEQAREAERKSAAILQATPAYAAADKNRTISGAKDSVSGFVDGGAKHGLGRDILGSDTMTGYAERGMNAVSKGWDGLQAWWDKVEGWAAKKGPNHQFWTKAALAAGAGFAALTGWNLLASIVKGVTGKDMNGGWMGTLALVGAALFAFNRAGKSGDRMYDIMDQGRTQDARTFGDTMRGQSSGGSVSHAVISGTPSNDPSQPPAPAQLELRGKDGAVRSLEIPSVAGAKAQPHNGTAPQVYGADVVSLDEERTRRLAAQTGGRHGAGLGDGQVDVVNSTASTGQPADSRTGELRNGQLLANAGQQGRGLQIVGQ